MCKKFISMLLMLAVITLSGCMAAKDNLSPFSPRAKMKQQMSNQNGKIGELETLNNAMKSEIGNVKSQAEIHARDIQAMQQGTLNKTNTGVQILSGDGVLIVLMVLGSLALFFIFHYRNQSEKNKKTAEILAQQIRHYDNPEMADRVCMAALNTEVEQDVYHLMFKRF